VCETYSFLFRSFFLFTISNCNFLPQRSKKKYSSFTSLSLFIQMIFLYSLYSEFQGCLSWVARWLFLSRLWPLLKQASFFRQLGQFQKLARALNRTTIGRFSLPKSLKHTVDCWNKCSSKGIHLFLVWGPH
jgi:hypothetical protein